jgi:hypothetical protein
MNIREDALLPQGGTVKSRKLPRHQFLAPATLAGTLGSDGVSTAPVKLWFRLDERLALDKVEELGADRDAMQALPLGSFIAWNRVSHARLEGKVF